MALVAIPRPKTPMPPVALLKDLERCVYDRPPRHRLRSAVIGGIFEVTIVEAELLLISDKGAWVDFVDSGDAASDVGEKV